MYRYILIILSLIIFGGTAQAVPQEVHTLALKLAFATSGNWHITAYQQPPEENDDGIGDKPARFCFWKEENKNQPDCTNLIKQYDNPKMILPFQTIKNLAVIHPLPDKKTPLLELVAKYESGVSGELSEILFFRYDKARDSFQKAGQITLTEQGEWQILTQAELQGWLITADAIWDEGETHFSPHHFTITMYRYTPEKGYSKQQSYTTAPKYPSFDDTDKIEVISHEMNGLQERIHSLSSVR